MELFDSRQHKEKFVKDFDRHAVDRHRASLWAQEVLDDPNVVLLDTETTDLDGRVVETAVVSCDGQVLLDTLINPWEPIAPAAVAKHGITDEMVTKPDVPSFVDMSIYLEDLLIGNRIVYWNADVDRRILAAEADISMPPFTLDWGEDRWADAMAHHAAWAGERTPDGNGYQAHRLDGEHRALGDCITMLARLREMASTPELPPPPKRHGWTEAEHAELATMARAGLDAAEIAARTGRTESAVRWRLHKNGLGEFPADLVTPRATPKPEPAYRMDDLRAVHRNSHKRWTEEEEQCLTNRHRDGATIQQLAEEFGRNVNGITARLTRLGLITFPDTPSAAPPF